MTSSRKILLIDKTPDRKTRINALKDRGYAVFPALKMEEARSRCLRGAYDLILVNAGDEYDQALQFCDDIINQCPKQLLRMSAKDKGERDYVVDSDLPSLLQTVDNLFQREGSSSDYASAA